MPAIVSSVETGSIAEELEIEAGDELLSIDGQKMLDMIDYGFSIVNMCSILKPYEIGEEFIPEKISTTNRSKFIIDSNAICPTRRIQS